MSTGRLQTNGSPRRSEPGAFMVATPSTSSKNHDRVDAEPDPSDSHHDNANGHGIRQVDSHEVEHSSPAGSLASSSSGSRSTSHKLWRRSGFLLGLPATSRAEQGSDVAKGLDKGKTKKDEPSLFVRKQRKARDTDTGKSYSGSPLAKEVKQTAEEENYARKSQASDHTPSQFSGSSHAGSSASNHASAPSTEASILPSIGFDTDSSQIVHMALALSEGRRRYFSNSRTVSNPGTRPLLSQRALQERRQGSLGQYFQAQRQTSGNRSPTSREINHRASRGTPSSQQTVTHPGFSLVDEASTSIGSEPVYDISDATYARVEKAKIYLELLYEYRRLLKYLPPLGPSRRVDTQSVYEGRVYNPLQYVRNRKVRFREKQPIPVEEGGWHDVERVRAWVDAATKAHGEDPSDPYSCVRLPQLQDSRYMAVVDSEQQTDDKVSRKDKNKPSVKPRRPRLDWVLHPSELLADAYWTEQGLNKMRIEDRDGNKIYSDDAPLKTKRWSRDQQGQVEDLPGITKERSDKENDLQHPVPPKLPSFLPTSEDRLDSRKGRRSKILRYAADDSRRHGSPFGRKRRKGLAVLSRSLSRSSSGSLSDSERSDRRGRARLQRHQSEDGELDISNVEAQMANMQDSERPNNSQVQDDPYFGEGRPTYAQSEPRTDELAGDRLKDHLKMEERNDDNVGQQSDEDQPRTSHEGDTTGPNSPTNGEFPSIAINLSPPASRETSPTRKSLPNPINLLRHVRNKSQDRAGVSTADFASLSGRSPLHSRTPSVEPPRRGSTVPIPNMSRDQSPFGRRTNTTPEEQQSMQQPRRIQTTPTKSGSKQSTQEQSSRIRGIFKGGRIAEIVGNEVSRVGDFIWKRDVPDLTHVPSAESSGISDVETEDEGVPKVSPEVSPSGSAPEEQRSSKERQQPQYHISNLPVFTSPFKDDQVDKESPDRQDAEEPVKQNSAAVDADASRRENRKSNHIQRLAPPRLDTSRTPSADDLRDLGDDSRRSSYFGGPLHLAVTGDSGIARPQIGRNAAVPVTGLSTVPMSKARSRDQSSMSMGRSPSTVAHHPLHPVNDRDLARARALLLTSALKAREISRRANTVCDTPPKLLLDLLADPKRSQPDQTFPPVPRKEQYIQASKQLISAITAHSESVRSLTTSFTTTTVPSLHSSLQEVEDLIENSLTPRVRAAADQAGELSQSLTTTSNLAVKQLNDSVDVAVRRSRKGIFGADRLVRRLLWGTVEGAVVGLLWIVWGLVTMIRVVRGVVRLILTIVKWLLWL